jgi:hypothetical protein
MFSHRKVIVHTFSGKLDEEDATNPADLARSNRVNGENTSGKAT